MPVAEPVDVSSEAGFQQAVVSVIKDLLQSASRQYVLFEGFGLDIAVFLDAVPETRVRLFEVKAFRGQRPGGVGFGSGSGTGPQVDMLMCQPEQLALLGPVVRWVYADALQAAGMPRYGLFDCAEVKAAAMGNNICRGKQNNLRVSALSQSLTLWPDFCEAIRMFLLQPSSSLSSRL